MAKLSGKLTAKTLGWDRIAIGSETKKVPAEGGRVLLDGGVGGSLAANNGYFLNTSFLHYRPMSGMDVYMVGGDREPINQDAMIRIIGFKGNMTLSGAQYQAFIRVD